MAESTSSASGLSSALSTIGNTVSSVVGGVGDLLGYVPVVGGFLDSGVDALGNVAGSLLSLGQMKTPAAAATSMSSSKAVATDLPVLSAGYTKEENSSFVESASRVLRISETRPEQKAPVALPSPDDYATIDEYNGAVFSMAKTQTPHLYSQASVATRDPTTLLKSRDAKSELNEIFARVGDGVPSQDDVDAVIERFSSLSQTAAVGDAPTPALLDVERTVAALAKMSAATGKIGLFVAPGLVEQNSRAAEHNGQAALVDAQTEDFFRRYEAAKTVAIETGNTANLEYMASESRELLAARQKIFGDYQRLKTNKYTNGFDLFSWDGTRQGKDWNKVGELFKLLSPLALAALSYYQEEKTAKRAHKWAVEDREDTQAFTAEENAATRASNEAMAAMESEDDSSGSVGASSAGSIGGSIASA